MRERRKDALIDGKFRKIPRPRNAFMIFANEKRREFQAMFQSDSNSKISTRLGDAWRLMKEDIKQGYFDRARQEDLEHKRKYPNYHYTPCTTRKRKYQGDVQPPQTVSGPHHPIAFGAMPARAQVQPHNTQVLRPSHDHRGQYIARPAVSGMQGGTPFSESGQFIGNNHQMSAFSTDSPQLAHNGHGLPPVEQSTVTRVLKWVPIQVINAKKPVKTEPPVSATREYVSETSHAYIPVTDFPRSVASPLSHVAFKDSLVTAHSSADIVSKQVKDSPLSLPPVTTLLTCASGKSKPPLDTFGQQQKVKPLEPIFNNLDNFSTSGRNENSRWPCENQWNATNGVTDPCNGHLAGCIKPEGDMTSSCVTSDHTTSKCISHAFTTLMDQFEEPLSGPNHHGYSTGHKAEGNDEPCAKKTCKDEDIKTPTNEESESKGCQSNQSGNTLECPDGKYYNAQQQPRLDYQENNSFPKHIDPVCHFNEQHINGSSLQTMHGLSYVENQNQSFIPATNLVRSELDGYSTNQYLSHKHYKEKKKVAGAIDTDYNLSGESPANLMSSFHWNANTQPMQNVNGINIWNGMELPYGQAHQNWIMPVNNNQYDVMQMEHRARDVDDHTEKYARHSPECVTSHSEEQPLLPTPSAITQSVFGMCDALIEDTDSGPVQIKYETQPITKPQEKNYQDSQANTRAYTGTSARVDSMSAP